MVTDRLRELMMAALDDEIEPGQRRELEDALRSDAAARAEWDALRRVKEATRQMTLRAPSDRMWQEYWTSVYSRIERGIGWILVSIGAIVLLSWGAWQWVADLLEAQDLPWFAKAATFAVVAGFVVLLVSVIREKLFVRRSDPYKDVIR